MKPYYQEEGVTIYHGDCREILPQLDIKADLVLTDPPWFVSRKVKIHRETNPNRYRYAKYKGADID